MEKEIEDRVVFWDDSPCLKCGCKHVLIKELEHKHDNMHYFSSGIECNNKDCDNKIDVIDDDCEGASIHAYLFWIGTLNEDYFL